MEVNCVLRPRPRSTMIGPSARSPARTAPTRPFRPAPSAQSPTPVPPGFCESLCLPSTSGAPLPGRGDRHPIVSLFFFFLRFFSPLIGYSRDAVFFRSIGISLSFSLPSATAYAPTAFSSSFFFPSYCFLFSYGAAAISASQLRAYLRQQPLLSFIVFHFFLFHFSRIHLSQIFHPSLLFLFFC